jgi:hypothetical protein
MYPPTIADDHGSHAEARVFRKLKTETPDTWIALHSVGLATHASKPWAEIDFVVLNEHGIYCLEVKGGKIEHHDGTWLTNGHPLRQSPFAQAGGGSSALHDYLRERTPAARQAVVGYGVLFPDVQFDNHLPEAELDLVYDDNDVTQPIQLYLDRLADHWRERVTHLRRSPPQPLSRADQSKIVHELAPEFQLTPSLRSRLGEVTEELVRWTTTQRQILDGLVDEPRVLVKGGAGTGKTLIAYDEAIRLARSGRSTLYCCYSKRLAEHLRPSLEEHGVRVAHAHGMMADLINEAGLRDSLPAVSDRDLFDVFYPQVAVDALLTLDRVGSLDAIVLDEGQDLLKQPILEFFNGLLDGQLSTGTWRVLLDPNQDIFFGGNPREINRLQSHAPTYQLRTNCRNTRPIALTTSILAATPAAASLVVEGPDVTDEWYTDANTQEKLVRARLSTWTKAGLSPSQIFVLSPRSFAHSICSRLDRSKLPRPIVEMDNAADSGASIRFSTVAAFKGLEADAILLTDIDDLFDPDMRSLLYVGSSRARAVLGVILDERCKEQYRERSADLFERLANTG